MTSMTSTSSSPSPTQHWWVIRLVECQGLEGWRPIERAGQSHIFPDPFARQVFSIGEEIKETNDSGFLGTVATIHTQLLSDNSMLQVHSGGLRHIRTDRRINEWKVPGRRQIQRAASNEKQVCMGLGKVSAPSGVPFTLTLLLLPWEPSRLPSP